MYSNQYLLSDLKDQLYAFDIIVDEWLASLYINLIELKPTWEKQI